MPHLIVAVSAHGYGHFSQVAPVVNALWRRLPDLRVTFYTGLARDVIAARLDRPFDLIGSNVDFGLRMHNAFDVDVESSWRDYQQLHERWESLVATEAERLRVLKPTLILANIPFLILAGAARAKIPSVALSSLHWAATIEKYFVDFPDAHKVIENIRAAYNSARFFIRLTPGMPMPDIKHKQVVEPIALLGNRRAAELRAILGATERNKVVLVTPGGIDTPVLGRDQWPAYRNIKWILPRAWGCLREDIAFREDIAWRFEDILASSDIVVTKPGYGSVVEAVFNGVPLVVAPRGDWPEEPHVLEWMHRNGDCQSVDKSRFLRGDLLEEILRCGPVKPARMADGATQAADLLAPLLIAH